MDERDREDEMFVRNVLEDVHSGELTPAQAYEKLQLHFQGVPEEGEPSDVRVGKE